MNAQELIATASPLLTRTPVNMTPQIAKCSYELYVRQGRRESHAVQERLQAERKIRKD